MEAIEITGYLAAALTTAANIPQTYIIIKEKSTAHVSVTTYSLLLLGTALWVVYGIVQMDWPIIIANSISALTSLIILILNFTSQRTINKIHKSVLPQSIKDEVKKTKAKK
ncbi:SemiSWEET family sugar transporter [Flavobacterium wongokense]|uniref:SemiSWEET family sugar transporter n=1 Tax=Flavobacterium wongokense TaxID=2910674 RepID=UPI001F1A8945|nr:SemiSWEET transporter [Flavobacterium sp. WG47]MCF6133240.1 SemiSWEET transporter [Flavobacterium sp. WG47]